MEPVTDGREATLLVSLFQLDTIDERPVLGRQLRLIARARMLAHGFSFP